MTDPLTGFLKRKMVWTLVVRPHLSGPNMMLYGVLSVYCFCKCSDFAMPPIFN